MLGLFIGIVAGAFQFWMLTRLTRSITGGKFTVKTVPIALAQFLFPFAVLLGCAFLVTDGLIWAGAGLAVTLTVCAAVWFVYSRRRR